MIKSYSMKIDKNRCLSNNFQVYEFACNDGSDTVLIDTDLVIALQKIRDYFGKPIKITSAYRTPAHNAKVGGSFNSYHIKGMAVDFKIDGVSAVEIGLYAQNIINGVGVYYYGASDFVHIDARNKKTCWLCAKSGIYEYYPNLMPVVKIGDNKPLATKFIQKKLGLNIDGKFGNNTKKAVELFQSNNNLDTDGVVGKYTWNKLFESKIEGGI